jgi:DnaJ-class molecular chaperone
MAGLNQAATTVKPVARPAVPAHLPDAQVERTIRAKFAKSKINVEHFTVSVQNGVATIEGKTNVIQHKGVATRLAKTGGALAVQNHIQISEEARAKAAAKLARYRNASNSPTMASNNNPGSSSSGAPQQLAKATVLPVNKPK